jgi:hypothetical protein
MDLLDCEQVQCHMLTRFEALVMFYSRVSHHLQLSTRNTWNILLHHLVHFTHVREAVSHVGAKDSIDCVPKPKLSEDRAGFVIGAIPQLVDKQLEISHSDWQRRDLLFQILGSCCTFDDIIHAWQPSGLASWTWWPLAVALKLNTYQQVLQHDKKSVARRADW